MKILFAPAARRDFDRLVRWSNERFGQEQTRQYVRGLDKIIEGVARSPKAGRPVAIRPGLRRRLYESHVVYYGEEGDNLRIVRILHARQDLERHL